MSGFWPHFKSFLHGEVNRVHSQAAIHKVALINLPPVLCKTFLFLKHTTAFQSLERRNSTSAEIWRGKNPKVRVLICFGTKMRGLRAFWRGIPYIRDAWTDFSSTTQFLSAWSAAVTQTTFTAAVQHEPILLFYLLQSSSSKWNLKWIIFQVLLLPLILSRNHSCSAFIFLSISLCYLAGSKLAVWTGRKKKSFHIIFFIIAKLLHTLQRLISFQRKLVLSHVDIRRMEQMASRAPFQARFL